MFNRLAEPALYRTIDLRMIGLPNGLKLLSTIAKNRGLGLLVKCVRTSEHKMLDLLDMKLANREAQRLIRGAAAQRIDVSSFRQLRSRLELRNDGRCSATIIITALLQLCQHLEVLDAHTEICQWALLGELYVPTSRVRYVAAKLPEGVGLELADVVSLLGIPSIQSLRVDCLTSMSTLHTSDMRSKLRYLYLNYTRIRGRSMESLLKICNRLSTLWINFDRWDEDKGDWRVREIIGMVQLHAKQLEELAVVADWQYLKTDSWQQVHPFDDVNSLRSLALPARIFAPKTSTGGSFNSLDANFAILPLTAILPLGLETLSITYDEYPETEGFSRDDALILSLLQSAAFSKLHTALIYEGDVTYITFPETHDVFSPAAEALGVSLYNLLQLVIRIACDARLGMMVKCISMEEDVNESLPMGTVSDVSMQNIAKVALARRHMESLGVMSVFGIWRSALDHVGNDDWTGSYAVISLLVILSPNLESMDVDLAVCQRVIPLLSQIRPQCLTRVVARLDADPEECMGETIPNVERYLKLPGLHSLRTDSMPSSHRSLTFSGFSTELRSSLKHLYFKETHMGASDIKMVLIACPQLLTLYMTLGEGASDGYCPEMYETVCAIQAHGQQLQELAIVAHGISGESRRSWRQIESFHQFDSLRFLAIPVELLIPQFAQQDYADEPFLRAGGRAILDAFQAEDDRETTRPVDYHYEVSRMPSEISRMNRRLSRDAYRAHTDGTMRVLAELFPPGLESLAILYEDKPEPFYLLRDDYQVETVLQAQALPALHTSTSKYIEPFDCNRIGQWHEFRSRDAKSAYQPVAPYIGV
ncbi:hypothetical protein B0A48_16206 [Cryoendolithus antarcticus]|uniref:Uncharacterized protein n=1 Tax=Cryoendolithus antarcticus TaxID=1507870 RepID=A0A1V8SFI4_9PEZI|nr:hypothetical protein B0A48_16206 [Cryoendolithus antarcticus]